MATIDVDDRRQEFLRQKTCKWSIFLFYPNGEHLTIVNSLVGRRVKWKQTVHLLTEKCLKWQKDNADNYAETLLGG